MKTKTQSQKKGIPMANMYDFDKLMGDPMQAKIEAKHTPTPWVQGQKGEDAVIFYLGVPVAKAMDNCDTREETLANAEFIVKAVNSHEANEYLADVVRDTINKAGKNEITDREALAKIAQAFINRDAAIAQVKGGSK